MFNSFIKLLPPLLISLLVFQAYGDDVNLELMHDGMSAKIGYYRPVKVELSTTKPDRIIKTPENISNPLFGTISMGPKESPVQAIVLIDEPDNGTARLWLDNNGNGNLTDDPPVNWVVRHGKNKKGSITTSFFGNASVQVAYGRQQSMLGINLYRFDKNDPERQQLKNALFYYRDFGFSGSLSIDGKTFQSALIDDNSQGDFRPNAYVSLLIDLNNNGKFEKSESFDVCKPFNIAGTTYEITELTAQGGRFKLVKSSKTVEEIPVPPALEIGGKPVAFEEKTTTGQTIKFPSDYNGKLVMVDFWATWCGPCRGELPNLTKVYEEFHQKGFEVLGVSLDNEESMKKLPQFTADNHMPWPQICDGNGWNAKLAKQYGVQGIPACWLIDGNSGLIVAVATDLRGPALRPTIERCLSNLGKLSATKPITNIGTSDKPHPAKPEPEDPLCQKTRELAKADKLLTMANFNVLKKSPKPAAVSRLSSSTQPLPGRKIAARAAQAYMRAGWIYRCPKCDSWHVKLAGSYAIANDTVVTAFHVMEVPDKIKQGEGYPVVVRGNDEIIPIINVLAADETTDAIILRVDANDLHPLAFAADAHVGDTVYCFSDPHGARGYFSSGIINRFYTRVGGSADNPADQRLNVSVEWAPGSSGAAVVDECGNIVGHVARIQPIFGKKPDIDSVNHHDGATPTVMTLHETVPAKGILTLIDRMNAAAARAR